MNVTSSVLSFSENIPAEVVDIISAAVQSVDPAWAVKSALQNFSFDTVIHSPQRIGLVSIGKASIPMARGLIATLGSGIDTGVVVAKVLPKEKPVFIDGIKVLTGNHPVPGEDSIKAGGEVLRYISGFGRGDKVFCLISGGASALISQPIPPITIRDMKIVTGLLLDCGASIEEINAVRKHMDGIKGGRLTAACGEADCVSLILSDVLGDRLDVIASGPTVPDESTFYDAIEVMKKYGLTNKVPAVVMQCFQAGMEGKIPETPKTGDPVFFNNRVVVIGSLALAMVAARKKAEKVGYSTEILPVLLTGEARDAGERLASFLRSKAMERTPDGPRRCWIAGGETTVTIRGSGTGGRNQELALAAVRGLDDVRGASLITFATDGEDGMSPAAGAMVTGETLRKATKHGLDPERYLSNNDSHTFFKSLDAAIITGSTGTNVNDLVIMLLD